MSSKGNSRTELAQVDWFGIVDSVQPHVLLTRSFDEREFSYLGYVLRLHGRVGATERDFSVAVTQAQHTEHQFRRGQVLEGRARPAPDLRSTGAEFDHAVRVKIVEDAEPLGFAPPWWGVAPPLGVYEQRGQRRVYSRTFPSMCAACTWGCKMPVAMVIDPWKPSVRKYRVETFCYGPLSCRLYTAGPKRKVPGRKGATWEEDDWVDAEATSHRARNE